MVAFPLFPMVAGSGTFSWLEDTLPGWATGFLSSFLMLSMLIGIFALAVSALFDAGRWRVQVALIGCGIGCYAVARWWFWTTRGEPIIFHPGFIPLILGNAAIFSGVVSLLWGLFRRSPSTRPGPGRRLRMIGGLFPKIWPLLLILVILAAIPVIQDKWRQSQEDPLLRNLAGRQYVATDLSHFLEGDWDTWQIRCPGEESELAPDEMGILVSGPGERSRLHIYPRAVLDGCTGTTDRGPHPPSRPMNTRGVAPAVVVDELPAVQPNPVVPQRR